jgi:hypothetical protein
MTNQPPGGSQPPQGDQPSYTPEQYQQAAADLAAQEAPSPAAEQAATAVQMTERGPTLPAEDRIEAEMAKLRQAYEDLVAKVGEQGAALAAAQKQLADAQAAKGGPPVLTYAKSIADMVDRHVVGVYGNDGGKFDPVVAHAGELVDAAQAAVDGKGGKDAVSKVHDLAARIEKFAARFNHKGQHGHGVDWSAILDEVAIVAEEALKLAA